MSKRSVDNSSDEKVHKKCNKMIYINHTNETDFIERRLVLKDKKLSDDSTDIKFIVDSIEINAHKEVMDLLKNKRQLVKDAIERDRKQAEKDNCAAAVVFQMSGTTFNAFKGLLDYIYTGTVMCGLKTAVELAITGNKLKFHPLVASIAQQLALNDLIVPHLSEEMIDDLYTIAKSAENRDLLKICGEYFEKIAFNLSPLRVPLEDNPNVLIYSLDKNRYINYIHFCLSKIEICFKLSVSSDLTNWQPILVNDDIGTTSWNWVYFMERKVKYIKFERTDIDGDEYDITDMRDDLFFCKRANVELEFDAETKYLIPKHDIIKYPIRDTKHFFGDETVYTYCMSNASNKSKEDFYYYHNIGDKKFLEFYLSQTSLIDSFAIRLWDLDDRTYDFIVEVKNENEEDFILITDNNKKQKEFKKKSSWQTINLRGRRPVRWIRITGTNCSVDDTEFAVIDIECPTQSKRK